MTYTQFMCSLRRKILDRVEDINLRTVLSDGAVFTLRGNELTIQFPRGPAWAYHRQIVKPHIELLEGIANDVIGRPVSLTVRTGR